MRVVFLTHNYPRFTGDVAGSFLHPLAVALHARGLDVRVVAPADEGRGGREPLDGIPVRRVRYGTPEQETLAYRGTMADAVRSIAGLRAFARLRGALRHGAAEELLGGGEAVVHAHWWIPAGMAAPQGTPMVLTCHGTDVRLAERNVVARFVARRVIRRAAVLTTVSQALAESIGAHLRRVPNALEIQPMPLVPTDRPVSRGGGGLVAISRLTSQKRISLLIEAVALVERRRHGIRLTIAGDGPEGPFLRDLARVRGIGDNVNFLGAVPPSLVPGVLATADCCIMAARSEGFGLVAAEALIQGVPVVACRDGGGVTEIVPAVGGGRIADPDPRSLADAIVAVLDDPAARDSARVAGEPWRRRLDPDFVAGCCLAWYQQALHA